MKILISIQPLSIFDTCHQMCRQSRMRLTCLTITTNQSLFLFCRNSDEHGNSYESEKAKQMAKKEVNIKPVQMENRKLSSSTGLNLKMAYDAFQTLIDFLVLKRNKDKGFTFTGTIRATTGGCPAMDAKMY